MFTKFQKTLIATASLLAVSPLNIAAADIDLAVPDTFGNVTNVTTGKLVTGAINFLFIMAGVGSFLYLLYGGVQWIMSGGDKDGLDKARKRITAALVGLAVVFSSYALIVLVQGFFGVNILNLSFVNVYGPTPTP